jgi:hypothetical protein
MKRRTAKINNEPPGSKDVNIEFRNESGAYKAATSPKAENSGTAWMKQ